MHGFRLVVVGVGAALAVGCGGTELSPGGSDGGGDARGADAASGDGAIGTGSEGGLASGSCRSNADCTAIDGEPGVSCQSPDSRGGCVAMSVTACTNDAQCDGGDVCRSDPFAFANDSPTVCAPPCRSDAECSPLSQCTDDGHCLAYSCDTCPSYYSCEDGECTIPSCTTDAECPGGYCVDGACAGALGACQPECV